MPEHEKNDPLFLTTKEVADLLRVKERKVYDLAAADEIPHRRITGKLLFPAQAIRSWIDGTDAPVAADRPNVFSGSHDPLLDWAIRASGCGLATLCNGSRDGLTQFQAGAALAAGLHLPEEKGWNVATVSDAGLTNCVLINWAVRKRGLLLSADAAAAVTTVSDLKGRRVALRQPGAGAALLFARLLDEAGLAEGDLDASKEHAHTESDAAAAVAAGEADVSLGIKAMAKQFNLAFLPLVSESYDILIDRKSYFTDPFQRLLDFAGTTSFREKADSLGGYDLSAIGSVRWVSA
ncbi:helix-turn-helix transcriptional regulator [uncultured Roseibium sp.]|uniref:helix-turn-helix transcriptional regulator n=1 Tax=uncultured Roseibium sp. TaxID=1936171 RepID=UPI002604BC4D|nr:helix-turn-helix transcriptional regulator [uncultured Roseibium sp.]